MIRPDRMRASSRLALALATLFLASLFAGAASSVTLRAASAQLRALQMAAGVLCAPGESGLPGHPAGHSQLGGHCGCPGFAQPDLPIPPAPAAGAAEPAAVARVAGAVAPAAAHPAHRRFVDARGPPAFA